MLKPEQLTHFDKSHLIEASGRGRRFFRAENNFLGQQQLIDEVIDWEGLSEQEKFAKLRDGALKCIDINGNVYTTMPASKVDYISAPIELTHPTKIQLNYENKKPTTPVFSDIDLEI